MNEKVIGICVHTLDVGGAQIQALMYAISLKNMKGVRPLVFSLSGSGEMESVLKEEGIESFVYQIDLHRYHRQHFHKFREILRISRIFRTLRFDGIMPFTYYPNVVCNLSAFMAGIGFRTWNQRGLETETHRSLTEKLAIKVSSIYISNSTATRDYLMERYKVTHENVRIIPNAVFIREPKMAREPWRNKLGVGNMDMVIVMVANYFPVKDHITAVEAFAMLVSKKSNVRLMLVGYSPDPCRYHEVKSLVFDRKLWGKVIFMDSTDDISGLLSASDIGLLTTRNEGSPNVILDYMMAGLPVVASDISPVRELIGGVPGNYLVKPENPQDLYNTLEKMIEDVDWQASTRDFNKATVMQNYNPDILKKNLYSLLKEVKLL